MESTMMEADSTCGEEPAHVEPVQCPPHSVSPANLAKDPINTEYFEHHIRCLLGRGREMELCEWLQSRGLLTATVPCGAHGAPEPDMTLVSSPRAGDAAGWLCETCGRRRPLRARSVLAGLGVSLSHVLLVLLAWTEDANHSQVAATLGLKEQDVLVVYERVESAAAACWVRASRLGGAGRLVLADMFPGEPGDLSPPSPDSSRQHQHNVLMLADTASVPTRYYLHVMSDAEGRARKSVCREVWSVVSRVCSPDSTLVASEAVPPLRVAPPLARVMSLSGLLSAAPASSDLAAFLSGRLWRQARALCSAGREVCGAGGCGPALQRYLHVALYRLAGPAHLPRTLALLATHNERQQAARGHSNTKTRHDPC